MLLFIPVLSVNIVNVSVKLLLSWNTIVGYSCFRFTALWNMLSKWISGGNRPEPVLLVRWALSVSGLHRVGAAVLARLCPSLEPATWVLDILNSRLMGIFASPKFFFFLKDVSLVRYRACVAKISIAHHIRRERSKNWETGGWRVAGVYFPFRFHLPVSFIFPSLRQTDFPLQGKTV